MTKIEIEFTPDEIIALLTDFKEKKWIKQKIKISLTKEQWSSFLS